MPFKRPSTGFEEKNRFLGSAQRQLSNGIRVCHIFWHEVAFGRTLPWGVKVSTESDGWPITSQSDDGSRARHRRYGGDRKITLDMPSYRRGRTCLMPQAIACAVI